MVSVLSTFFDCLRLLACVMKNENSSSINFFQLRKHFRKFSLGLNVIRVLTSYMSYVTYKFQADKQSVKSFATMIRCQRQKKKENNNYIKKGSSGTSTVMS